MLHILMLKHSSFVISGLFWRCIVNHTKRQVSNLRLLVWNVCQRNVRFVTYKTEMAQEEEFL